MYSAYFVNTKTGELYLSYEPKNNKHGKEWKQVTHDEFKVFLAVAHYYKNHD